MDNVSIGVIGCGGMGGHYAKQIANGNVTGAELGALCDIDGATGDVTMSVDGTFKA